MIQQEQEIKDLTNKNSDLEHKVERLNTEINKIKFEEEGIKQHFTAEINELKEKNQELEEKNLATLETTKELVSPFSKIIYDEK